MVGNREPGQARWLILFFREARLLTWPFWAANLMEMIERLAYYGVRVVIPIYIAQADEPGGLHFTQAEKGFIFFWWALVQCMLPVFTGGFADRYGYKKQIALAIALKIAGYIIMGSQRGFWGFFTGCIVLAAGTAIFKPPIQATFARTLDEKSSGIGWGFFYMVVNVGGFLGPPAAHFLYGISWPAVFYGCSALVSLNFTMLFAYREKWWEVKPDKSALSVVRTTFGELMNARLVVFLLIASAFWASFTQLWDMLPNFIVDWVDTEAIAVWLPAFMRARGSYGVQLAQEWIINLNPLLIIVFVAPLSWMMNRSFSRLATMTAGVVVASAGMLAVGSTMSGYACLAGIALFSFGEMMCSPKMNEYLAVIAPHNKKALYMGYANIPFAIGWAYGSLAAGGLYARWGEKATLAIRYLREEMKITDITQRSSAFQELMNAAGCSWREANSLLWEKYHPWKVWLPFAMLSLAAALALYVFMRTGKERAEG